MAIRGDVVRALIELITNADDAYGDMPGSIRITIERTNDPELPIRILVQDTARGLDARDLLKCFTVLGGEKEGEDAIKARGLLGRGAKDVASLGRIEFLAIKNDKFSRLVLTSSATYNLSDADRAATEEDRMNLGLESGENGFTNILWVGARVRVPKAAKLQHLLGNHAQLRDLVRRREVILTDKRDSPPLVNRLIAPERRGDIVLDEDLAVAGYDVPVHLRVRRLPSRSTTTLSPYSEQGLIVSSGISCFENTWFELDRATEADFFAGEIDAPQIADIIRAYDRKEELGGPSRLLSRDRDGLLKNHPYRQALAAAVSKAVKPIFDELASKLEGRRRQGESLTKALRLASDALKDQLNKAFEEIDEEAPQGGDSPVDDFLVIPPRRIARPGEAITLTVRSTFLSDLPLTADLDAESREGVISGVVASPEFWMEHKRLSAFVSHVYVSAGQEEGTGVIRISQGEKVVRATIIVATPAEVRQEAPDSLEIVPSSVKVAPSRAKSLIVRAPIETAGLSVAISYDGCPLKLVPASVTLSPHPEGRWAQAPLRIEAGLERGVGRITCALEGFHDAVADVSVDEAAGRGGLGLSFEVSGHKSPSKRVRTLPEDGSLKVVVYAHHPSYGSIFGPYSDSKEQFENEDTPAARAVLAEVIASELAQHLTERDYAKRPDQLNDAARIFGRQTEFEARFLAIAHNALQAETA